MDIVMGHEVASFKDGGFPTRRPSCILNALLSQILQQVPFSRRLLKDVGEIFCRG